MRNCRTCPGLDVGVREREDPGGRPPVQGVAAGSSNWRRELRVLRESELQGCLGVTNTRIVLRALRGERLPPNSRWTEREEGAWRLVV